MFSQESVKVNRGPIEGTQLFMFAGEVEGARVTEAPRAPRAFPRSRASNCSQRSASRPFQKGADREKQTVRAMGFAPRSDAGKGSRVNKVMLTGRLGRNTRLRETSGGRVVADFFLGTEEFSKDVRGEWQQKTAWHRVQVWGEAATMVGSELQEGSQLYVEGRLVIRKWTDKNNKRQTFTEILASDVLFLNEAPTAPVASGASSVSSGDRQVATEAGAGGDTPHA